MCSVLGWTNSSISFLLIFPSSEKKAATREKTQGAGRGNLSNRFVVSKGTINLKVRVIYLKESQTVKTEFPVSSVRELKIRTLYTRSLTILLIVLQGLFFRCPQPGTIT